MNKLFAVTFFIILFPVSIYAQIYDPITWSTGVKKIAEDEWQLVMTANIEEGWHLYSLQVPKNGPLPTTFGFVPSKDYELIGELTEDKGVEVFDQVFEMPIKYFETEANFKQIIRRLDKKSFKIRAVVEFMVCDDERCLPPTSEELVFYLPEIEGEPQPQENKILKGPKESTITQEPEEDQDTILGSNISISPDSDSEFQTPEYRENRETGIVSKEPVVDSTETNRDLSVIFLIAFFSGFAALLTPCVFPMIPLTISYFTKQSKTRAKGIKNAGLYAVSIVIIYVVLGLLVTLIFGADALNALSTNVWFNLFFFALLVLFAFSFLGAFEITLPNSWATKADSIAGTGGFVGIFFMAMALAIVSFSCTGPIVGALLVEAASKGGFAPVVGMAGFSLALALPFALFAAFPGWLNSLPKSGSWLITVKATLGFLELALAFKFLSNADLVLQLHLLERETFIAIWVAIFGVLALYLLGIIHLPGDSSKPYISVGRLGFAMLILAFTLYLIPGLWGAPLKLISGFPPPMEYSESPDGVGNSKATFVSDEVESLPEGAKFGPHNIVSFLDYEKGLAYAKRVNKPVLLDFTGHACVNCRKMEERVWSEPKILEILKNDVVLVSLYVDDKRKLPENERYISETTGKKINTIGNKWSDFQIERYKANAQPFYVLIDHQEKKLINETAYEPNVDKYFKWLQQGKNHFENGINIE